MQTVQKIMTVAVEEDAVRIAVVQATSAPVVSCYRHKTTDLLETLRTVVSACHTHRAENVFVETSAAGEMLLAELKVFLPNCRVAAYDVRTITETK